MPVLASMSFEAGGRTFTGCTVESFAATARGLGADAVGINCSLGQHGQAAVLLDGQQGGLQLIQIGKGLKEHEVSPGGHACPDDAAILCHGILKRKGAVGFQQLPQRAHIQRGQCTVRGTGPLAVGNARCNDLLQRVLAARQLVGGSAKGIGIDDAAACGGVLGMDALDERRISHVQLLGTGPQFQARSLQHGAHAALLLAVTLGPGVDAQIRRAGVGDIAAGVASDALGSALAEQAAEAAEAELRQWAARQGKYLTGRYSPGYGDWPLAVQPLLAAALDTARRAGLCVTENNLMTPRKSITAILGVSDHPVRGHLAGCGHCVLRTRCEYRKRGITCASE